MGNQRQVQNPARHAQSEAARLAAQRKMYCVWFVAVVVPFAILFCLFPSSNHSYHGKSRLPASSKARLIAGDNAFRQQVIVEDPVLNSLEQGKRVKSLVTKAGGRSSYRKSKDKAERGPDEVKSTVGFENRVRDNYGVDTTKSEMQGSAADDWKKRSNENVRGKLPTEVPEPDELGSIFGVGKDADSMMNSRSSQRPKRFSADSLQSSDSAQRESGSVRGARNESPASSGLLETKRPSEDFQRLSKTTDVAADVILRDKSTSTGSSKNKIGTGSIDFSRGQQLTNRDSELFLPEVVRMEEDRTIKENPNLNIRNRASVECNISEGNWIPDNVPRYANASCPWIDEENEKCINGSSIRNAKYPQWRWKPTGCVLKRFNAKAFLKTMERKAMAFVGDSVARAQARSLLCLLAQVESPTSIYVSKENQSSSWHFPSSNFTLTIVWSPFLVQETEDKINGAPDGVKKVRLDVVELKWARLLPKLDAVVLSAGSWFRLPVAYVVKNQLVGCHGCGSALEVKELGLYSAYRAATRSAIIGVTTLPLFTGTTVLQQTFMEDPGSCTMSANPSSSEPQRRTRAEKLSKKMNEIQKDEFDRALKRGSPNGSRLELLETTTLTFQHPTFNSTPGSVTMATSSFGSVDFYCSFARSCLTGPSLTWNQLLLRILRRASMDLITQ